MSGFTEKALLAGRYRILRTMGEGGMGVVVCAMDEQLHREVAIKLLKPQPDFDIELVQRFLREARVIAGLESPHVVRLLHTDQLDTGEPFLVMEMLRGEDLASVLGRLGRLRLDEAVWYALSACQGLAEAHRRGIIHRDLKPANLFLDRRGSGSPTLKVLDFGIAKVTAASTPHGSLATTAQGTVLGTPLYMSPEQRSGERVDERTDLWSLGMVLYELVAGALPFPTESLWQFEFAVRTAEPRPLSTYVQDLPEGVEVVLRRCLEKDPAARYANVAELAAALVPYGPREAADVARSIADARGVSHIASGAPPGARSLGLHETLPQWKSSQAAVPERRDAVDEVPVRSDAGTPMVGEAQGPRASSRKVGGAIALASAVLLGVAMVSGRAFEFFSDEAPAGPAASPEIKALPTVSPAPATSTPTPPQVVPPPQVVSPPQTPAIVAPSEPVGVGAPQPARPRKKAVGEAACAKPCSCWDEKNNPCPCLYPCAADCKQSESLCKSQGAR